MSRNRIGASTCAYGLAALLAVAGCAPLAGTPHPAPAAPSGGAGPTAPVTRIPVTGVGQLQSIAVAPGGDRVYVMGSDGIAVLGTADAGRDPGVVATIPLPVGSVDPAIALAPDGARAYVATARGISVIDTAAGAETGGFPDPVGAVEDLVVSPDGTRLYTLGTLDDVVSVLDARNGELIGTVPLGGGLEPRRLALTPDGREVRVATGAGLVAIDTGTGAVTATAGTGDVHDLAISPDGTRTYVSVAFDRVAVVEDGAPAGEIPIEEHSVGALAVSADGGLLFAGGYHMGGARSSVIDTATGAVVATVELGHSCEDVAFAPDADVAYAVDLATGSVSVVDLTALR